MLVTLKPRLQPTTNHQPKNNWGKGRGGRAWLRLKDEILARDNYTCQACGRVGGYQKVCERKIASGDLTHANQPLMAWCVGNARVKLSGAGVMMSKAESGNGKIDPVIAMLNAVALMSQNPANPKSADDVGIYF